MSTDATTVQVSIAPDATTVQVGTKDTTVVRRDDNHTTVVAAAALGPQGLKGDKGDRGDPGTGSASYVHTQGTPDTTWTINHNLGYYPNVTVIDSAGSVGEGDIDYVDINTIVLTFSAGFSGQAYLS